MKSLAYRAVAGVAAALLLSAAAQAATLSALDTFGGGDGWLSPSEATFLQGASVQRGLSYNPTNNHVYVVDRNGGVFVRILDGNTGALLGSLDTTGVAGGTFALSMIDVAEDGTIYAANLSTTSGTTTQNFKVYRWANEAAAPTVAFDGLTGRARTGDTFAVRGSGVSTEFVAAGGSTAGQNYSLFSTVDGLSYTSSNPVVTGAATGAFRLGIDFANANVLGKQTSAPLTAVAVGGGAATTSATQSAGEGPIAFDQASNLLASVDVNNNLVRLYDGSVLSPLALLDSANNTTGVPVANSNGVGDLKFGRFNGAPLRLYVLNTNNGIQAFVIPEPGSIALLAMGALALVGVRRR